MLRERTQLYPHASSGRAEWIMFDGWIANVVSVPTSVLLVCSCRTMRWRLLSLFTRIAISDIIGHKNKKSSVRCFSGWYELVLLGGNPERRLLDDQGQVG